MAAAGWPVTGTADEPSKPDDVRIIECSRMMSAEMLTLAIAPQGIIRMTIAELLNEVPSPDFIEIRAIRYEPKEDTDGGHVIPAPPG